jgi:hypothetical protein
MSYRVIDESTYRDGLGRISEWCKTLINTFVTASALFLVFTRSGGAELFQFLRPPTEASASHLWLDKIILPADIQHLRRHLHRSADPLAMPRRGKTSA